MKLSPVILVFVACVVFQASAQAPLDCFKQDFSLNNKCCKEQVGSLITNAMVKSCKPTAALLKWMNNYMINKLLKLNKTSGENKIDLKSSANQKVICTASTFVNCVFELFKVRDKKNTYYNGTNAMKTINMTSRPAYYTEHLAEMVGSEDALQYATEMFNTTLTCTGKEVYIGNMFLVQYLQGYIALICPTQINDTKTMNCTDKIGEKFSRCHSSMEDNAWNGQKSELPAILKDVREKIYKSSAVGKKIQALRANNKA